MIYTYKVTADTCNNPRITYERSGLTAHGAKFLVNNLSQGFRQIEVYCEQTGEIVFNRYVNGEFYELPYTAAQVLSDVDGFFDE